MTNSTSTEPTDAPLHRHCTEASSPARNASQALADAQDELKMAYFHGDTGAIGYDPDAALRAIQTVEAALAEARQLIEAERPEWSR